MAIPTKNELIAQLKKEAAQKIQVDPTFLTKAGIDIRSYQQYQELDYLFQNLVRTRTQRTAEFSQLFARNRARVRGFVERLGDLNQQGYGLPILLGALRQKADTESLRLARDTSFLTKQLRLIEDNFRKIEESRTRVEAPLLRPLIEEKAKESITDYNAGQVALRTQWKNLYRQYGISEDKLPKEYK